MGATAALQLVRDTGLAGLVRRADESRLADAGSERLLPVLSGLRPLLPGGGLRRGCTVAVSTGSPAVHTSVLLALLAEASRAGSWCAIVGVPTLGAVAAAELGIALDRLALVPYPGPQWPTVVAALLDGFDIVVTAPPGPPAAVITSRLTARARHRGNVLVVTGGWPGADLVLEPSNPQWHGLGQGRGRLRGRQLTIEARGRGGAVVSRHTRMWLPAPTGLGADRSGPPHEARGPDRSQEQMAGPPLATVHPIHGSQPIHAQTG